MEKHRETIPAEALAQVEDLKAALPAMAESWRTKDEHVSAFAEALLDLLQDYTAQNYLASKLFAVRDISPEYAFNLIRTTVQVNLAPEREVNGYPFKDKHGWSDAIVDMMARSGIHHDDIEFALENRDVQTNIEDRYKLLNALLSMFEKRFGAHPKVADLGCGQNRGLAAIMDPDHEFEPLEVVNDPETTNELNQWIKNQLTLLEHLGIDAWELRDQGNRTWSLYNGYPSEQTSPDYEQNYQKLIQKRDELGVGFVTKDLINDPLVGTPEIPKPGNFDAVFCSMLLYEHSQENADKIISVAEDELLDQEKGIFIMFDAVEIDPSDRNKLIFSKDHSKPYTIRLVIKDLAHREEGYQEVLVLETGRALKAKKGLGYTSVKQMVNLATHRESESATSSA